MPDEFRRLQPGDKFRPSARAWNTLMDVAADRLAQTSLSQGLIGIGGDRTVSILNTTDGILPQFAIVGLGDPTPLPEENLDEFRDRNGFKSADPATTKTFGILANPVEPEAIDVAVVIGVARCLVDLADPEHGFAYPVSDEYGHLHSGESTTSARILWRDNLPAAARAEGITLLTGATAPSDADDGDDGDYFADTDAEQWYGPKADGAWGEPHDFGTGIMWAVVLLSPPADDIAVGIEGDDINISTTAPAWSASQQYQEGWAVSLRYTAIQDGTGHELTDTAYWLPLANPEDIWNETVSYEIGDFVIGVGGVYVCILANTNHTPPSETYWNALPTSPPADWDGVTAYVVGDFVLSDTDTYVCIADNTNETPPNVTFWKLVSTDGPAVAWSGVTAYPVGWIVTSGGDLYICRLAHTNHIPPNATYWDALTVSPTDDWDATISYTLGDFVFHNDDTYVCINTAGVTLDHPPPNSAYWRLVPTNPSISWGDRATYQAGQIVSRDGDVYICILGNTNQSPPNATYWTPLPDGLTDLVAWSSITTYAIGDSVSGATYVALAENLNVEPDENQNTWEAIPGNRLNIVNVPSAGVDIRGVIDVHAHQLLPGYSKTVDGQLQIATYNNSGIDYTQPLMSMRNTYGSDPWFTHKVWVPGGDLDPPYPSNFQEYFFPDGSAGSYGAGCAYILTNVNGNNSFAAGTVLVSPSNPGSSSPVPENGAFAIVGAGWYPSFGSGGPGQIMYGPSSATAYDGTQIRGGIVTILGAGPVYVCISGNIGQQPPDGTYWKLFSIGTGVDFWSDATSYIVGDFVVSGTIPVVYICISGHANHEPPNATYWRPMPTTWANAWDNTTNYITGDAVSAERLVTAIDGGTW